MKYRWLLMVLIEVTACTSNPTESALEKEAKEAVASLLKDPESAKFQNLSVDEPHKTVCGEVNSKNGFGAYAGVSEFIYVDGTAHLEDDSDYASYIPKCTLFDDASNERMKHSVARLGRELKQ